MDTPLPLVQEAISYENQKSNLGDNFGHLSTFLHHSDYLYIYSHEPSRVGHIFKFHMRT